MVRMPDQVTNYHTRLTLSVIHASKAKCKNTGLYVSWRLPNVNQLIKIYAIQIRATLIAVWVALNLYSQLAYTAICVGPRVYCWNCVTHSTSFPVCDGGVKQCLPIKSMSLQ